MTLLIVDDEESNRDMLSRRLKRQGFGVMVAADGPQALDCVRNHALDLVLLDIRMPGMSGMEVLKAIREGHSPTQLPVIMVTAESNSSSIVEALDLGANDYITKPVDLPVALARIRTHLSQKTLQEALRESEERYALAARGANDGLWDWNLKTGEIYLSARWKEMIGYAESEIGNQPEEWFSRVHPDDRERLRDAFEAHRRRQTPQLECEQRLLAKDGTYRWILTRGLAVWDGQGETTRMAGSHTDITVAKVADPLTGLPNRLLFMDRLERLIQYSRRRKDHQFAVLFLDVDRFKNINDSLGHLVGDLLLQALAERLRKSLRAADTVSRLQDECGLARLGGDEFAVLLDEIHQVQDAVTVAERIAAELQPPFLLDGSRDVCHQSASASLRAPSATRSRKTSCATPTRPCTAPRKPAGRASRFSTRTCARGPSPACSWRPICGAPSSARNCASTTSRSSTCAPETSRDSRAWCAGSILCAAWSARRISSPSPRRPA